MASFKETRNLVLECYVDGIIDEDDFMLLYDINVKFRILMFYNHDVIRLQQKPTIRSTCFSGLPTLITEHAWYCGMSNT